MGEIRADNIVVNDMHGGDLYEEGRNCYRRSWPINRESQEFSSNSIPADLQQCGNKFRLPEAGRLH